MPLPDERPRQSVANLIGRFEQQNKRQSLTNIPSRSSTPVSHLGDSINFKEEPKEKREWPPKPKQQQEPSEIVETVSAPSDPAVEESLPKPSLPTPDASPKPDLVELPISPPVPEPKSLPVAVEEVQEAPAEFEVSIVEPEVPAASPEGPVVQPVASKPTPSRQSSLNNQAPSARTTSVASKAKAAVVPRASAAAKVTRPSARSPPTSFHGLSSAPSSSPSAAPTHTPVKAKSTAAAAHTQRQPRPSSSASVRPPLTPARAKTPSSTARPRTPASMSRPKTPSSGLFAPTAASLAKARIASDAPPVPVKKHSLGSDVMDRLSKPTASSMSKARISAAAASPAKASPAKRGVAPVRGAAPGRGTAMKTRTGVVSPKKTIAPAAAASATSTATAELVSDGEGQAHDDVAVDAEPRVHPMEQEEHIEVTSESALVDDTFTQEPEEHEHAGNIVHEELTPTAGHEDEQEAEAKFATHDEPEYHRQTAASSLEAVESDASADVVDDQEHPSSPSPVKAQSGDDLEDLITMLEAKKPLRPSLPEVVAGEIPDEE